MLIEPKRLPNFDALKIITQASATLHRRASQGLFRADVPQTQNYLKACRLVLPQLAVATVLAYEDLQPAKERPPEECRFALHFCMTPLPDPVLRKFLERDNTKLLDEPGWHQRGAFAMTIYGADRKHCWGRMEQHAGEDQFHVWLFVEGDYANRKWVPRQLPADFGWTRAQGMRTLAELLD